MASKNAIPSRNAEAMLAQARSAVTISSMMCLGAHRDAARGDLEALLRKEAIYSSQLATWREQPGTSGEAGLTSRRPGRKPKLGATDRALLAATKQNETLQRKLRVANALIALQKTARAAGPDAPRAAGGELMRLVEQRDPEVSVYAACQALNVSRASLYRSWRPPAPPRSPVTRERAPSPRRLDDAERQEILDTLHLPA